MIELSWRGGLDASTVEEVTALAGAATELDGTEPLSEHVLLHLRPGAAGAAANLLAVDGDGTLVGFAHLDPGEARTGGTAELAVHPAHRGAGTGARMVGALLERAAGGLHVWAHGKHPAAVALANRLGFTTERELLQLRRSLSGPLATPELPDGVRLRPFVVGVDEAEFLRVNNAAFDWHPEQGGWDAQQVELREGEEWFDPAGFLLAVDADDRLLGFHWTKVHAASGTAEHTQQAVGEVYVLGVDPSARGMRLGSALTLAGLHHLRDLGLGDVLLYVESDNHAAVRVYQDLGFTRWSTDVSYAR